MLLNSLSATENILGSAHNNNNNPTSSKSHFAEPDSAEQQSDNMGNNVKLRAKQVVSPKDKSTAPTRVSAPAVMNEESANKANTLPKTETGKSVIVNLALPGGTIDEKHRLTRLLREVNEMREIRERHDSYASEQSLEANILKNKDKELQRITKIQRSKKLLFKYKVYQYLKRPTSFAAMVYHVFAFILVASCLILSVFPAMERQMGKTNFLPLQLPILDILEKTVLLWFTTEYILMLWASECRPQYQGLRGKIAFIKSPAHLIDLLVIILSAALPYISTHDGHEVFAFRAFRGFHRFFQVLQVIALKRQLRPWQLFWSVLYDQREQLLIIFYLEIVLLCLLSYLGFLVEHEANENLENIADAMWWSVVTLTTVGYGDKTPITALGKLVSGLFILFGVAVFALPAGIIGAGLALKLEEVERTRQRRLKKEAAAKLIQRAWKCYRANHAYFELSQFFRHQPGDLFKVRVYDNIKRAFIEIIRFSIAKNSFKEVTRPVDLRNVIESYKYGQMDIFARLKQLNSALDLIITRMSVAENERVLAINQLARKLESMEMVSGGESGTAIRTKSDGTFHLATTTGSLDTALGTPNAGLRYLDLFHLPPMPTTNTHPSTIPLRSRPNSLSSHHATPHSHYHHPRPYSTANCCAQIRSNSLAHSDHTFSTIDEVTVNEAGESESNMAINSKFPSNFNSSISFLIEDYSHKVNPDDDLSLNNPQSSGQTVVRQRRQIRRRHSQ